jgi:hypothetical protein
MTARRREQPPRFLPSPEALEDRCCPVVSIVPLGRTLLVLGDGAANTVTVTDQGNGTVAATVTGPSNSAARTANNVTTIVVLAGDGADTVTYQLDSPLTTARALLVELGRGNDSATLDASAGVDGSYLLATALGGDGNDTIQASVGGVAAGAAAALGLEGGRGGDTLGATSAGLLNGALAVGVAGGLDGDTLAADLTVDAGSTGALVAAVGGGAGDDGLTLNVHDNSGGGGASTLRHLAAVLDGGAGTDTCAVTGDVDVINCEA